MHTLNIITKEDLEKFKSDIIEEVKRLIQPSSETKQLLKSCDVRKILGCSPGTLQNLRITNQLPFSKIGGTIYYKLNDVNNLID